MSGPNCCYHLWGELIGFALALVMFPLRRLFCSCHSQLTSNSQFCLLMVGFIISASCAPVLAVVKKYILQICICHRACVVQSFVTECTCYGMEKLIKPLQITSQHAAGHLHARMRRPCLSAMSWACLTAS